jgi:hypothetical protein
VNILQTISQQFTVSKPVFVAELEKDCSSVSFIVNSVPYHNPDTLQDPVAKLIAKNFTQTFDMSRRCFVQSTHLGTVHCDIIDHISQFYEAVCTLKNPTQSKLYKWLRSMDNKYNHEASEGFIALYRYIRNSGARHDANVTPNVLAILEMMREKYESK